MEAQICITKDMAIIIKAGLKGSMYQKSASCVW